ncbi:MAG: PHP domain-containing protein [Deltaproteobacteria bacterium]|nr:PHP domain-containing protein [Deltaproteobacteria bacterium]
MKIDLHIHSKDCSDGKMTLPEIFAEAHARKIELISITDHDSIGCQEPAATLAKEYDMHYLPGVELSISFSHPRYGKSKPISLDVLGYMYDIHDRDLTRKLRKLRDYRRGRAERILEKVNQELDKARLELFTHKDLMAIRESVDGAFGRPHIADYMVKKGIVSTRQAAFDHYLVKCNVPKMPLSLEEASDLIRGAGGKLILAHPNNPNGTSLASLTPSIVEQHQIIKETMLPYLDGIECWHPSHDRDTVSSYLSFARKEGLMVSGGSDCHQQPPILGTMDIPSHVADQFNL